MTEAGTALSPIMCTRSRCRGVYGAGRYRRLRELKRAYDPDYVFRMNLNIAPAQ
jgi:hypothetical protein